MSEQVEPARRGTFVAHDAVYAAAGASSASDLLRFPPEGSTPFEERLKLGSGAERFLTASNVLMTWGAQRGSGIEVTGIAQGTNDNYAGITFDKDGTPEVAPEDDVRYGPDGEAFLTAGTTALLTWPGNRMARKMRVVYVIDEPKRAGFALGTADNAGVIGETSYTIEHFDDDSVWGITRGFYWAPENGLFGLKARAAIRLAVKDSAQHLAALVPGAVAAAETLAANAASAVESSTTAGAAANVDDADVVVDDADVLPAEIEETN